MAIVMMGRKFHQPPSPFYGNAKEEWGGGGGGVRSSRDKMLKGEEMQ